MKTNVTRWILIGPLALAVAGLLVAGLWLLSRQPRTHFVTHDQTQSFTGAASGSKLGDAQALRTNSQLTYTSPEIPTDVAKANLVGVQWHQDESTAGDVALEIRTWNGKSWNAWTPIPGTDDGKDGTEHTHTGIFLTRNAAKAQYRFHLTADATSHSPTVSQVKLTAINSLTGPDPAHQNLLSRILSGRVLATPSEPVIYSRTQWGAGDGESSPAWPPEYRPLYRVIVHHTAASSDSYGGAAAVRGIWYYHTYTNGWGDIGYNYVVDQDGSIYQGRYFNHAYAINTLQDVVGGHAYGNNYGTTGIATLGNFSEQSPTGALINSVATMAARKGFPYGLDPGAGSNLVGHRDVGQTACPGNNLYNSLGTVRSIASTGYGNYANQYLYDWRGQRVNGVSGTTLTLDGGGTATVSMDYRNLGNQAWMNSGVGKVWLATARSPGHSSQFADSSWASPQVVGTFSERVNGDGSVTSVSAINPGETGRFTFKIRAPVGVRGTFKEYFRPLVDGYAYMPQDYGTFFTITVTPPYDYSYQGEGVNGSPGGVALLQPTQTTTLYLDLKNEGNQTWHSDGSNPVRLGTDQPHDRNSQVAWNWLSLSRPGTFVGKVDGGVVTNQTTIAPGETARFSFDVRAPNQYGTYREYFQPVAEGLMWFPNDVGIHWDVVSAPSTYLYQWVNQTYGVPTEPGQTGTISVDAKNTGNVSWHSDGANPVRLGTYRPRDRSSNLRHSSWIGASRPVSFSGRVEGGGSVTSTTTIAPGETARFQFTAQAPTYPFVGNEYFNLVAEGKTWMNDVGMFWPVNIPQNYHVQWAGQSAAPTISKGSGGIGSMYFDFKNTGSYPWRKGQIVHLGTANPLDRASRFFATGLSGGQLPADTANWDSANRTGSFAGKVSGGVFDDTATVVNPGETARFTVALDARNVNPGTYREYVRPVADGFAWLEDYGVFLDVNVTP